MTPAVLVVVAVLFGLSLAEESLNPTFDAAAKFGAAVFQTLVKYRKAVKIGNYSDVAKIQEELFENRHEIIQMKNDLAAHPNPKDGSLQYSPEGHKILMGELTTISTSIDKIFLSKLKNDSCSFLVDTEKELNDNVSYIHLEEEITKKFDIRRGMISLILVEYERKRKEGVDHLPPLNTTKLHELVCEKWKDLGNNETIANFIKVFNDIYKDFVETKLTTTTTSRPLSHWDLLLEKVKHPLGSINFERIKKVIESLKARYKNEEKHVPFDRLEKRIVNIFTVPNKAFRMYRHIYDSRRQEALQRIPPKLSDDFLERIVWNLWKGLGDRIFTERVLNKTITQLSKIK